MKEIIERAYTLLRKNTSQIIYVTMMIFAIEAAYGCVMFICACIMLPELSRPQWIADNLPHAYTPEVIAVLVICLIVGYMIVTPVSYGVHWCFYQGAKGHPMPLECMFTCILNKERRRKVWVINVVTTGSKIMLITAAASLVRTCRVGLNQLDEIHADPEVYVLIYSIMITLLTVLLILYSTLTVRYFMVPYIFAEDPDGSARQILLDSVKVIRKKKAEIFTLKLFLIPLFSLSIFGFPLLAAIPIARSLTASLAYSLREGVDLSADENSFITEYYI